MKKQLIYSAVVLAMGFGFVSCSDDDGPESPRLVEIGFEGGNNILAGSTSYGANLYYGYDGTQFTEAEFPVTEDVRLHIGINESIWTDEIDFYGGGMALSQWNIRSNPADQSAADWWYSYNNQCSVYNLQSVDGANTKAGAGGSDTFVIATGYSDPNSMSSCSRMYFTGNAELQVVGIDVCNSSYAYGVLMNGNPYGNDPGKNIQEAEGWFKVEFYGFDSEGNPTNGGAPVEFYLCDYRPGSATYTETISKWTNCDLSALGKVNAVEVNFKGSDTGLYGLNTPAYVCLDNFTVSVDSAD
ncbi:MAG: DUF4465 domain-containing protein [Paramuribaculum sp.]|nr:DUF4465 domain-containing protein [Paramuribaculum sp.]